MHSLVKPILGLGMIFTTLASASPRTKVTCMPGFGPDQKIEVQQNDDGSLELLEYHDGSSIPDTRVLSAMEWKKERIRLRTNDMVLLLGPQDGSEGYLVSLPGSSFNESGPAGCIR